MKKKFIKYEVTHLYTLINIILVVAISSTNHRPLSVSKYSPFDMLSYNPKYWTVRSTLISRDERALMPSTVEKSEKIKEESLTTRRKIVVDVDKRIKKGDHVWVKYKTLVRSSLV